MGERRSRHSVSWSKAMYLTDACTKCIRIITIQRINAYLLLPPWLLLDNRSMLMQNQQGENRKRAGSQSTSSQWLSTPNHWEKPKKTKKPKCTGHNHSKTIEKNQKKQKNQRIEHLWSPSQAQARITDKAPIVPEIFVFFLFFFVFLNGFAMVLASVLWFFGFFRFFSMVWST